MKMKKTRILSAILAMLMLVSPLASCATGDGDGETQAGDQTGASTEAETGLKDNLPDDLNYGGDKITFISRYREGWTSGEISVDKLRSEPVNDAVYERNKQVENRLKIVINNIEIDTNDYAEVPNKVKLAVQAGTGDYDIMAAPCIGAMPAALEGNFVNLLDTEYINLSKPWWSQGFNEVVEYNHAQYTATGAIVLSMYRFAFVTVFNQKLFDDADQTYLYDYVDAGTWTLDKQASIVPSFHVDNGNSQQDTNGDIFGLLVGNHISVDPYWSSCDISIIGKGEDGTYTLVFDSARLQEAMDKILFLYYQTDSSTYVFPAHGADNEQEEIRNTFADGRGAMATLRVLELENGSMRNMTDKYGVVPMPKFDEHQAKYQTYLHDQFSVLSILTTVKDDRLNEVSATLEALASASYRLVRPAYYETTLRTKIAQDPQSSAMMEIIMDNIYIDAGILYTLNMEWFYDHPRAMIKDKQNTTVSHYRGAAKSAKSYINKLVRKLDKLAEQ